MSDTHEFAKRIVSRLSDLINSNVTTLIGSDASKHDHLTGTIQGLSKARLEIEREVKQWSARDDEAA